MKQKFYWYWVIFAAMLLVLIFIQYFGIVKFHYSAPSGDDPVSHYNMAKPFYNHEKGFLESWEVGSYPPLYHYTIAHIALLFKTDLLSTMNWTYPSIIVFADLSILICAYFLFGPIEALIAFFFYGFTAQSSIQLLLDGGYPNLIAAHIILPIFILFFIKLFQAKIPKQQWKYALISFFLGLLIVLTHHTSTFYLFGIVGLSLPFIIIYKWTTQKWLPQKGIVATLILILVYGIFAFVFFRTDLLAPIKSLYNYSSSTFDPNGIWLLSYYPDGIGRPVYYFGILGLIALTIILILKFKNKSSITTIILLAWSLLLYVGSRLHMANPERMARDAVVPLAICSGIVIVYLIRHFKNIFMTSVIITVVLLFSASSAKVRLRKAIHYEPMIRMTEADAEAVDYLKTLPSGLILTNETNGYLPLFLDNVTFNTAEAIDPIESREYKYLLIVDAQTGWVPDGNHIGAYKNINQLQFIKLKTFMSETRTVSIYLSTLP